MPQHNFPIKYTCNSINYIIGDLSSIVETIESWVGSEQIIPTEIQEVISELKSIYSGSNSHFEFLRDSNDKLRTWGEEGWERFEEFEKDFEHKEKELEELESSSNYKISTLENELIACYSRIKELEEYVEELNKE